MPEDKSILQQIGDAVVNFAPGIAGILAATGVGAPAAGAVTALGALGRAFGLGGTPRAEDVLSTVIADPEMKIKAMIAENDYSLKMRQVDLEEIKAGLADIQNARLRQTESEKATGKKDTNLYALAWLMVMGFFVLMGVIMFVKVPDDSTGVVFMLFGALSTSFGCVINYFFGSSQSSKDKNDQISQIRKQLG